MAREPTRRDFLTVAISGMVVVGGGFAAWPLIDQGNPNPSNEKLDFLDVDLRGIAPGTERRIVWRGSPFIVRHRTDEELAALRAVDPEKTKGSGLA